MNWRSSSNEQAAGDCPNILTNVTVKSNLKELALKKNSLVSYMAIPCIIITDLEDSYMYIVK